MTNRRIHVACAIIEQDGRILAARRSATGSMPGKWEFPGGKMKPREEPEDCVQREIREELGLEVRILRPLPPYFHEYRDFEILLYPFICAPAASGKGRAGKGKAGKRTAGTASGDTAGITLRDHSEIRWDLPEDLAALDWAEADIPVLEAYTALKRVLPAGAAAGGTEESPEEGLP